MNPNYEILIETITFIGFRYDFSVLKNNGIYTIIGLIEGEFLSEDLDKIFKN